jgi:tRNA threonylcarbamoyladenosine biosynthesis protein TsaB
MSTLLHIDTATENASVSIAVEGKVIVKRTNTQLKDHAGWIHIAIQELFADSQCKRSDIKAIAVVGGPGSYTGVRVGMATAKGFAYALQVPLIVLNTLACMAYSVADLVQEESLICPMIDARRMEVFTALYNKVMKPLLDPCAMILEADSFNHWLHKKPILFLGSGIEKWKALQFHDNAQFTAMNYQPEDIAFLSYKRYLNHDFDDLAYSAPIYLKEFHNHQIK